MTARSVALAMRATSTGLAPSPAAATAARTRASASALSPPTVRPSSGCGATPAAPNGADVPFVNANLEARAEPAGAAIAPPAAATTSPPAAAAAAAAAEAETDVAQERAAAQGFVASPLHVRLVLPP